MRTKIIFTFLWATSSLCMLSFGQGVPADPSNPVFYTVNAAQAYTWPRGYPQSCECAQGQVKKNTCDMFRCDCICDVTAGVCDYNCCCDLDCSADQKSRFDSLDACESEGNEETEIQHCYSSNELYGVNPREPMGGQPTANEAVSQALCVVQKNTAIKEEFYNVADVVSSSVFTTDEGQKSYSYLTPTATILAVDANYDQNDTIGAFTNSATIGFASNGPGYLQLPQPDFTGQCNDQNYVSFENNQAPQSCARTMAGEVNAFVAQCEQQFSVSRYVKNLYIATAANSLASNGNTAQASTVPVTLSAVYFEDYLSGTTTDVTAAYTTNACATTAYLNGATPSAVCGFSDAQTATALLTYPAFCQGLVKAVYYTVTHATTTEAPITSVTATVTLSDVPMEASAAEPVTVTQTFSSRFNSSDSSDRTSDNGNLIRRTRSGNPGYLLGKPVLYGQLAGTVVNEFVTGFTVPTAIATYDSANPTAFGKSVCPTAATAAGGSAAAVQFGYDLTSGCSVSLNRSALIDLCCAGSGACSGVVGASYRSAYSDVNTGLPWFYAFTQGNVGIYGDADPLDAAQWSSMTYSVPSDTRTWNELTSTCSNMFSGMEIQFLVAATGSRSNPQNKIISSIASVTTGDWVMKVPVDDAVSTQTFPLTITVSFVFQDENEVRDYIVPAPPVLFKVPYDVFYPFLSSAPPRYASSVNAVVLVMVSLLGVWFAM